MGLRIDKTEAEFQRDYSSMLPAAWTPAHRQVVTTALIRALDLEFQEPEGRGEGVRPEEVQWQSIGPNGARKIMDAHGNEIGIMAPSNERVWGILEEALVACDQVPALLGLAQELEGELREWHCEFLTEASSNRVRATEALLTRARDLLARLEGGRE